MLRRARWVLALGGCALGCGETPAPVASEFRFDAPVLVYQAPADALSGAWLVDAGGGRVFAVLSAKLPDGAEGALVIERLGSGWSAPFAWTRPLGAGAERVMGVVAWPSPAVLSLATTATGSLLVTRTFAGRGWSAPVAVTTPGAERPVIARLAEGGARTKGVGGFDLVYGVASTGCEGAMELRHRRSAATPLLTPEDLPVWGAARTVASTCGVSSLAAATDGATLAVAWTGAALGLSASGARDVYAARGVVGTDGVGFGAPTLVMQGANRDVSAAPLGAGAYLLGWAQRASGGDGVESGLQRAAWASYDPVLSAWTRVNTWWFFSRGAPVLRGDGEGTALALGRDGDFAMSPVTLVRWTAARAVRTRSGVGNVVGEVTSMSFQRMDDGGVEAIWVEALPQGGGTRVMWTRGAASIDGGV